MKDMRRGGLRVRGERKGSNAMRGTELRRRRKSRRDARGETGRDFFLGNENDRETFFWEVKKFLD
jgi:hypothetical protein